VCELLAVASRFPTTVRLSLDELARHGGETGPHGDGWGIALLDERDALLLRDPEAASRSPWVRFFEEHQPRASIAIAHVRKATQGARKLSNTQPFTRELGGRTHVFAHNGMLTGIERDARFRSRRFHTIGETDSEYAFCALLERLAPLWEEGELPAEAERIARVRELAAELRTLGPANFLYSDGDLLFAHAHQRRQADGVIRSPGLHVLCRTCTAASDAVPLAGVSVDPADRQEIALVASVPLSGEPWEPLGEAEIAVLRAGRVLHRLAA
jgi:predicted glutamine amidotransferase